MPAALLMAISVLAGCCIALQGPINAVLARGVGSPITAALISFAAGIVGLAALFAGVVGPSAISANWRDVPGWIFVVGGLLGAAYIVSAAFVVPRLGVATFLTLAVAGQLLAGLLLDHFGAFGLAAHTIGAGRLVAAGLIVAGVVLVRMT